MRDSRDLANLAWLHLTFAAGALVFGRPLLFAALVAVASYCAGAANGIARR